MLGKFTEKALKGVILSQQEARRLSHNLIGTEHLLLGLIAESTGIPVRVLKAIGVTLEALRRQTKLTFPRPNEITHSTELQFSQQAIKALKMANDKAANLGYIYVGSEHVFIALLASDKFGSVMVLKDLGVDLNRIRETVMRITTQRSLSRAHPEIQASKKLTEISKAIQAKAYEIPFNLEDLSTLKLINIAKEEMKLSNNDTIGTEHLLSAFIKDDSNPYKVMFENEGLNDSTLKEFLSNYNDRNHENDGNLYQFTPVAYKILEASQDISAKLGYGTVKPEHILLSMLKEEKGIAFDILKKSNINNKILYEKIISPIEKQKPPTLTIIRLAQEEAKRYDYNVVGTEHMLLGLLVSSMGVAYEVLSDLGVTLKDARLEVENTIGSGTDYSSKEITFTPRAKRLLELAWEEAKKMNHNRIESEHLLLAITRLKDCMGMKILAGLGVDAIEIKQGVISVIENKPVTDFI